jgi:DNA invertase Pin-like site-specific DNA recombinase
MANAHITAHGYYYAEVFDPTEVPLLDRALTDFCRVNDYTVGATFLDTGYGNRPGLEALLALLHKEERPLVVVPMPDYLSRNNIVRDVLVRRIRATGSELLVIYPGENLRPATRVLCPTCSGVVA